MARLTAATAMFDLQFGGWMGIFGGKEICVMAQAGRAWYARPKKKFRKLTMALRQILRQSER